MTKDLGKNDRNSLQEYAAGIGFFNGNHDAKVR